MGKKIPGFSAREVLRATRVSGYDTLDYWLNSKLITASETQPGGQRRFNFADLVGIKVIVELREAGVSLQAIRKVADRLREAHGTSLSGCHLLVSGGDVLLVANADELLSILQRPGQAALAFLVDLGRIETEVKTEVRKLGKVA